MSFQHKLRIAKARCLVALFLAMPMAAMAAEVWVISDQHNPVDGFADRVIELDAPQRIEDGLAANLPHDIHAAEALVRKRMQEQGQSLQRQMQQAYQGVVDAWSMGIVTVPAIVVDQRYVVYGETDVDRAVARVVQYRGAQP